MNAESGKGEHWVERSHTTLNLRVTRPRTTRFGKWRRAGTGSDEEGLRPPDTEVSGVLRNVILMLCTTPVETSQYTQLAGEV